MKIRKFDGWKGDYRGVTFEIINWETNSEERPTIWNYYLTINLDKIPKKYHPRKLWLKGRKNPYGKFPLYGYSECRMIADLDWHGGITYYEKLSGFDGAPKIIRVGCDYNHISDLVEYDLETVKQDCFHTIDFFLSGIPEYGMSVKESK